MKSCCYMLHMKVKTFSDDAFCVKNHTFLSVASLPISYLSAGIESKRYWLLQGLPKKTTISVLFFNIIFLQLNACSPLMFQSLDLVATITSYSDLYFFSVWILLSWGIGYSLTEPSQVCRVPDVLLKAQLINSIHRKEQSPIFLFLATPGLFSRIFWWSSSSRLA